MSVRTQDEIAEKVRATRDSDLFGFAAEVLLSALDFDHARRWLKDDAKAEEWTYPLSDDEQRSAAVQYLQFALDKAGGHRGISASRSVEKLGAWLWLLGLDHERFESAGYAQYGVPQLFVAAEELGVARPVDDDLVRMSQGLPCRVGCQDGCGT